MAPNFEGDVLREAVGDRQLKSRLRRRGLLAIGQWN
jgi:hypothetical protein